MNEQTHPNEKFQSLTRMDGSGSTASYIVLAENDQVQVGIKVAICGMDKGSHAILTLRAARNPAEFGKESIQEVDDEDLGSSFDWSAFFPDIEWEVEDERRARTTLRHQVEGFAPGNPDLYNATLDEQGDIMFAPMLTEVYNRLPNSLKRVNSEEAVRDYLRSILEYHRPDPMPKQIEDQGVVWAQKPKEEEGKDEEEAAY